MKRYLLLMFALMLTGCSSIEIIETGDGVKGGSITITDPNGISIFRSSRPDFDFSEIGIVSVKGISGIAEIYLKIREESSKKGANAVIDFDIESEEVVTTSTSTSCTPEGGCSTHVSTNTQIHYTASGTLVKKI